MTDGPTVLVVGAGSIGRRHATNLVEAGADVVVADLDADRARAVATEVGAASTALPSNGVVPAGLQPHGVVVASPTSLHRSHAEDALAAGAKVLVEKPLATTPEDAQALAAASPDQVAVAFNLRFHAPVVRTAALIAEQAGTLSAVRLWFGSWLPDWRPGTDYRQSYSARSDLGGGVLLDAIHELDLLVMLLGTGPYDVRGAVVDRIGPLEIDVEDTVDATLRAPGGTLAHVTLDYLARAYRRGIEATGSEATVRLDWARNVIEVEGPDRTSSEPADTPLAESYVLQDRAFVEWIGGGPPMPVDARTGCASVELAEQIRVAAR